MERRGSWQAGIVAAVAGAFDAGLVIARITSDAPLGAIGVATFVMLVALYFVFAPLLHTWPFGDSDEPPRPPAVRQGGVVNHPGAKSTHVRSRFKNKTGIENLPGDGQQPGGQSHDEETTFE